MSSMLPSVLLVEDDEAQRITLEAILSRDFRLKTVSTRAEAIRVLASRSFDVALLDQNLPNGTGTSIISVLQSGHAHTVIILFTGEVDDAEVIAARTNKSVFRIVLKPYDPQILISWIGSAVKLSRMRAGKT